MKLGADTKALREGLEGINDLVVFVFGAGTLPPPIDARGVGDDMVGALVDGEGGKGKSNRNPPSGRGGSE